MYCVLGEASKVVTNLPQKVMKPSQMISYTFGDHCIFFTKLIACDFTLHSKLIGLNLCNSIYV